MKTTNLGFPNAYDLKIKKAVEGYWRGEKSLSDIEEARREVERFNDDAESSLDLIPLFDIDIYDRLLKTAVLFGIVPERFGPPERALKDVRTYLSIARGNDKAAASPMVKWFNTNYHVVQPEIERDPEFLEAPPLPVSDARHKVCLIGPWTFLSYAINKTEQTKEVLFKKLSREYIKLIHRLPEGAVVQLEEPSFITHDLPDFYTDFIKKLKRAIHLHVYFASVKPFAEKLFALPVAGIGLDFIDGPENLDLLDQFPKDKILIAGIINGRNVWPATTITQKILKAVQKHVDDNRLFISPSCPLAHLPVSLAGEKGDFVFAVEKLQELQAIKEGTLRYREVGRHPQPLPEKRFQRSRKTFWVSDIPYPTTTIGSFPQDAELKRVRTEWQEGKIEDSEYLPFIREKIKDCIKRQEALGLDLLVHGEFERNDMVQYFAEHFEGMTPIRGWVQSYGTRYVRPPVITGPVKRGKPFTVPWITYAQSLTRKPVKGMLTGPVTIVEWSYPREDIPREAQFYEVAEALADEVKDLVAAGIIHIQIDEPAIREGLPLTPDKRKHYLHHAVNAFRRVYAEVPEKIVIHSHICFSEFSDIMEALCDMGVDVLSIEESKAQGKVTRKVAKAGFPASIGLGVFDVHSPRIPTVDEITKIPLSLNLDPRRLWINPDCGLRTRGEEAYRQLKKMMKAAHWLREKLEKNHNE